MSINLNFSKNKKLSINYRTDMTKNYSLSPLNNYKPVKELRTSSSKTPSNWSTNFINSTKKNILMNHKTSSVSTNGYTSNFESNYLINTDVSPQSHNHMNRQSIKITAFTPHDQPKSIIAANMNSKNKKKVEIKFEEKDRDLIRIQSVSSLGSKFKPSESTSIENNENILHKSISVPKFRISLTEKDTICNEELNKMQKSVITEQPTSYITSKENELLNYKKKAALYKLNDIENQQECIKIRLLQCMAHRRLKEKE